MLMLGRESTSCPMTCVFFRLMVSPKSRQALLKRVTSCWRSSAEWAVIVASYAKRKSRRHFSWTSKFALSLERLKSFPPDLVLPSVAEPKACFSLRAKKIPNRVGARILLSNRLSVFTHNPTHPVRFTVRGEAAPYWLGAAQLEAGGSCQWGTVVPPTVGSGNLRQSSDDNNNNLSCPIFILFSLENDNMESSKLTIYLTLSPFTCIFLLISSIILGLNKKFSKI